MEVLLPGHECNSPDAPSHCAALYRDTALLRPPYIGTPTAVYPKNEGAGQKGLVI